MLTVTTVAPVVSKETVYTRDNGNQMKTEPNKTATTTQRKTSKLVQVECQLKCTKPALGPLGTQARNDFIGTSVKTFPTLKTYNTLPTARYRADTAQPSGSHAFYRIAWQQWIGWYVLLGFVFVAQKRLAQYTDKPKNTIDAKIAALYYSQRGYWKGQANIKKIAESTNILQNVAWEQVEE
ncbi:hypothetical protein CHS0354_036383 [Potamilus streckersoni]|uniref:Uncharacterized protein n=1 Tax=Potamilus streckersoni TaxID=2493646 RepID=A0AAE0SW91_9BIVA|nr:hypothetical protein CHS0354_036383 [Potamilus streckersoni]